MTGARHGTSVVAVVPAFERADSVGPTVRALLSLDGIDEVIVVDDGSSDDTSAVAAAAGATVVSLDRNVGKSGAVRAGLESIGESADIVLLIDADTGDTATEAGKLLEAVSTGRCDMAIAVLPDAAGRGGFGLVRDLAAEVLRRGTDRDFAAPLSGQRAVRRFVLDDLGATERFGLEVALTLDAVAGGHRVEEVVAEFDHRHTGRSLAGFRHRFRQGRDLYVAGASRLGHRVVAGAIAASLVRRVKAAIGR